VARPRKKIDTEQLEKLAMIGCTTEEIAGFFEVSRDTIERRYAAIIAKGRQNGKIRLRRLQLQIAEKGNAVMAIWLGKQMLGQTDKIENSFDQDKPASLVLKYKVDE
jgi:hypothetical protein